MQTYQAMSNDQIRAAAPSVFATSPWVGVSDKYAFIPTIDMVEAMRSNGFEVAKAYQSMTRIAGKQPFAKHMLRFRRTQDMEAQAIVGAEVPEIIMVNSHDLTSVAKLMAGMFRFVCGNGMVVPSASFGEISVRHSGRATTDMVIDGAIRIVEEVPAIMENINVMKSIQLTRNEQVAFASAANQLRYPDDEKGNSTSPIDSLGLLRLHRYDDKKSDLWTTFNTVQENVIKGGVRGLGSTGRRMTTRPIKSVNEDIRLNKALWTLAESMAALKAA